MRVLFLSALLALPAVAMEINVPEGGSRSYSAADIVGSAELRKTGLGTLTLTGSGTYTGGAVIAAGTVVAGADIGTTGGATTDAGIFGTAETVTVLDGGAFSRNKKNGFKNFTIAGAGPDGRGALGNWTGSNSGYANGGIPRLTLAGDATLGGNSWMCVATKGGGATSYVDMGGHVLSIATTPLANSPNNGGFVFALTEWLNGGEVKVAKGGRLDLWGASANFGTTALTVEKGGSVDFSTKNIAVTVPTLTLADPTSGTMIGEATNVQWSVGTYVFSNAADYATFDEACRRPLGAPTKFVKAGPGVFSTGNTDLPGLFLKGIEVREGRLVHAYGLAKHGVAYHPFGPKNNAIRICSGATFDVNGSNHNDADYRLTIAGDGTDGKGAIVNTGTERTVANSQMIGRIALTDDASVGGTNGWSLTVSGWAATAVELNGHTLTKKGDIVFGLTQAAITSAGAKGAVRVAEGTLTVAPGTTTLANADLVVGPSGTLDIPKYYYKGTLKDGALACGCDLVCEPGATITGDRWATDTTIAGDFVLDLSKLAPAEVRQGQTLLACDLANAPKPLTTRGATRWGEYYLATNAAGATVRHPLEDVPVLRATNAGDVLEITNNCDCVYSGTLKGVGRIVKHGTGTLTLAKSSTGFAGTLVVAEGTVVADHRYALGQNDTSGDLTLAGIRPGENCETVVVSNGARVVARVRNVSANYVLSGSGPDGNGALYAGYADAANDDKGVEAMTLAGDATVGAVEASFSIVRSKYGDLPLAFNGHALTVRVAPGRTVWMAGIRTADAGTVMFEGGGTVQVREKNYADFSTATAALAADTTLSLPGYLRVRDFAAGGTVSGTGVLHLLGTLGGAGPVTVGTLVVGAGATLVHGLRAAAPAATRGVVFDEDAATARVTLADGGDWLDVPEGTPVLTWAAGCGPLRGDLVAGGRNAGMVKFRKTDTGFVVVRRAGTVMYVGDVAAPAPVPTPVPALSLRLAGYNVLHEDLGSKGDPDNIEPGVKKINHPWNTRKDDLVAEIDNLACDVLCTQEMSLNQRAYVLEHAAGGYAAWGVPDIHTPAAGASNHVLWKTNRFECVAHGAFYLGDVPELCVNQSWGADSRSCAWAVLRDKATARECAFMSVHFTSSQTNAVGRARQFGIACRQVAKLFPATMPCFLTGDYNTCLGKPELKVLDQTFVAARSILAAAGGTVAGPHRSCNSFITKATLAEDLAWTAAGIAACDAGTNPEVWRWYFEPIDHIYCRGDVEVTAMGILNTIFPTFTPNTYASDHNAHYADIVVR